MATKKEDDLVQKSQERAQSLNKMEGDQIEYVWLQDGRRIAYQEMGCKEDNAAHSLLVLHGAFSSRLFAMPGVSEAVLQDFGVRLVSIDRPGYGESDPHPSQTLLAFTRDMETVMDQLHLGTTVWLLGYSLGAMYCWAAARYIPHRLAGIALWSPAANFEWKFFTPQENEAIKAGFSWKALRALYFLSKSLSFSLFRRHVGDLCRQLVEKSHNLEAFQKDLPEPDKKALERPDVLDFVLRDRLRSVGGWTNGFGLAKDFQLLTTCWGFELNDIGNVYQGQIHIWQGDVDSAVPLLLQKIIKKELPLVVKLHELHGEGHFSWYYFNNYAHYSTLSTLFKRTSEQRSRI